jgi:signal recognition particle receptor subunit alpha
MIDAFYIFTKGGLLLWSTQLVKVAGNPLDRLIREVLLEERMGESQHQCDSYKMSWKLENTLDLFFVVVYQSILPITYLEGLLTSASKEFIKTVDETMGGFGNGLQVKHVPFDAEFRRIREKVDKEQQALRKKGTAMRSFADTKKGQEVAKTREEKGISAPKKKTKGGNDEDDDEDDGGSPPEDAAGSGPRSQAKAKGAPASKKKDAADVDSEKPKKGKEARKWDNSKVTAKDMDALDFSKNKDMKDSAEADRMKAEFIGDGEDEFMNEDDIESLDDESDDGNDAAEASSKDSGKPGRMGGLFKSLTRSVKNITGGAMLGEEDLEPVLHAFKSDLMSKNVAAEVSNKLADSVRTAMVGKTTERFTSISKTVKAALKESIETLLTPKKSVDVLRAAMAAKNAGRVYVIVFLGVNGVGKSTNLAKVAYYLKNKGGLDVLICACDTFRAGAVEQLKTHARCLDVPLFERGYGKDPAEIAKSAIQHARSNGHEVVLVDTAGRMQDNEPLMRALAKLVAINNPDLVLFVGEALVGNDAIDQVTKFNRSLVDMSENRRGIDGMLLTKYDTVDDKVGAALSMVYVTGQPVVFVGTGQKYTHLRKMQAKEVARTLLG